MKFLRWMLVLFVLLVLGLGALLALFPAKTAIEWAGDRLGAVQLSEVGGTIWDGHAGELRAHGKPLGRVGWQISPWAALSGRLDGDLQLDGAEFKGQAHAQANSANTIDLTAVTFEFPAERLSPALDIPGLTPVGRVHVDLRELQLVAGFPRRLNGEAVWRGAAVAGEAAAQFGDLRAEFRTTASGEITGLVNDLGGPLSLEGSFTVGITGYDAEALLAARDGNPDVIRALGWIGEAQADGSSVLKISGRLLPLR